MKTICWLLIILITMASSFSCGWLLKSQPQAQQQDLASQPIVESGSSIKLPSGEEIIIGSGHRAKIDIQRPKKVEKVSGNAVGGTARGTGALMANVKAALLDLAALTGSGGDIESKITASTKNGPFVIIIFGIILVLAGLSVIVFLKAMQTGLIIGGVGVAFIGGGLLVQAYPWVLLIMAAGILGGLGYLFYRLYKSGQIQKALKGIVQGIENAPADAQAAVKTEIGTINDENGGVIKTVVSGVKANL